MTTYFPSCDRAATRISACWRGYFELNYGALYWARRRREDAKANAGAVLGRLLMRSLGRVRGRILAERRLRHAAAVKMQQMCRQLLARHELKVRARQAKEQEAAANLGMHVRAWLRRLAFKRRYAAAAAERARNKALLLLRRAAWRWRAARKARMATALKAVFIVCALCLKPNPQWFHDATADRLCHACLATTQVALGERRTINPDGTPFTEPEHDEEHGNYDHDNNNHHGGANYGLYSPMSSRPGSPDNPLSPTSPLSPGSPLSPDASPSAAHKPPSRKKSLRRKSTMKQKAAARKPKDPTAHWAVGKVSGRRKPPLLPFIGLVPLPLQQVNKVKSAVATLQRSWRERELELRWQRGSRHLLIDLRPHVKLGFTVQDDLVVTKVRKGGQAEEGLLTVGSRLTRVEGIYHVANPVLSGRTDKVLSSAAAAGSSASSDGSGAAAGTAAAAAAAAAAGAHSGEAVLTHAFDLCRRRGDEAARLHFQDRVVGTCELPGCTRAVRTVFRTTESRSVKHASGRQPRVLRACLHCAAVLRDEYAPMAFAAPPPRITQVDAIYAAREAAKAESLRNKQLARQAKLAEEREGRSEQEQEAHNLLLTSNIGTALGGMGGLSKNQSIRDGLLAGDATLVAATVGADALSSGAAQPTTAAEEIALRAATPTVTFAARGEAPTPGGKDIGGGEILGQTGSAFGYFQNPRMWVPFFEYADEVKAADRICGFMLFTVRRHRWVVVLTKLRAKRNRCATSLQSLSRGRAARQSLAVLRTLSSVFEELIVPRLLHMRRFLGVAEFASCMVAPLLHTHTLDPPPPPPQADLVEDASHHSGKKKSKRQASPSPEPAKNKDDRSKSSSDKKESSNKKKSNKPSKAAAAAVEDEPMPTKNKAPDADDSDAPKPPPRIPSVCVASFLFERSMQGARLVAPRQTSEERAAIAAAEAMQLRRPGRKQPPPLPSPASGYGCGLTIPLEAAAAARVQAEVELSAANFLVGVVRTALTRKRAWRMVIQVRRDKAAAWLRYTCRCQWAANLIQSHWRASEARTLFSIKKVYRHTAQAVANQACNVAALVAHHRDPHQSWFVLAQGRLGSARMDFGQLLAAALYKAPQGPQPLTSAPNLHSLGSSGGNISTSLVHRGGLAAAALGLPFAPPGDAEQQHMGRSAAHDGRGAVTVNLKPPPSPYLDTSRMDRNSYPRFLHPFAPAKSALPPPLLGNNVGVKAAVSVRLSRPNLASEEDAARALHGQRRASQDAVHRQDAVRAVLDREDANRALALKEEAELESSDASVSTFASEQESHEGKNGSKYHERHSPYALPSKPLSSFADSPKMASLVPLLASAFHDHWRAEWHEECAHAAADAAAAALRPPSREKRIISGVGSAPTAAPGGPSQELPAPPCWKELVPPRPIVPEGKPPRRSKSQQLEERARAKHLREATQELESWHDARLHRGMVQFKARGSAMVDINRPLCLLPPSQQAEMLESACSVLDALRRHGGQVGSQLYVKCI